MAQCTSRGVVVLGALAYLENKILKTELNAAQTTDKVLSVNKAGRRASLLQEYRRGWGFVEHVAVLQPLRAVHKSEAKKVWRASETEFLHTF